MAKETLTEEVQGDLQNFSWDAGSESFFGISESEEKVDKTSQTIQKINDEDDDDMTAPSDDDEDSVPNDLPSKTKHQEKPKSKKDESISKEDEEEEDFFDLPKGAEPEEKQVSESTPEEEDKKFYTQLAKELKERGTFSNVEISDETELDEESFFEHMDKEVDSRVEEFFESFFQELDEDGKRFLQFKKNGGNTREFFSVYGKSSELNIEEFDGNNKDHIKQVLRYYYTNVEPLDSEEDVNDKLEWLEEGGKAKAYAQKYFDKIKKAEEESKASLLAAQQQRLAEREQGAKKFVSSLSETLTKTDEVFKFKFSEEDKKTLTPFITKGTVKVGKNNYIPEFNAKLGAILRAETPEQMKNLLLLAKLVKSNFDTTDLVTEVKTKVTQEVKSKLKETKRNVKPSSSGNNTSKSLSDYF